MKNIFTVGLSGSIVLLSALLTFAFTGPGYNPGTANPSDPDRALTSTDPDPSLKDIYDALTSTDQDPFDDTQITPSSGIDTNPYSSLKSIWNEIYNTKFGGSATLTSANILTGKTIFGVEGNVKGGSTFGFGQMQNFYLGYNYGADDWEAVTIGSDTYLALAGGVSTSGPSYIYKYLPDANCFGSGSSCGAPFQTITGSYDGTDWEAVTIGSDTYLVFSSQTSDTRLYKWLSAESCFGVGSSCNAYTTLSAGSPESCNSFTIGSDVYLLCIGTNNYSDNTYLFKWMSGSSCFGDGTTCSSVLQLLTTYWSYGAEFFTIDTDTYLIAARSNSGYDSELFKWISGSSCFGDGSSCGTALQTISNANTTYDWEAVTIGNDTYLAAANMSDASKIYKWMSGSSCFGDGSSCNVGFQTLATDDARNWESFTIDSDTYLAAANSDTASFIYKWISGSSCFGDGTTCGSIYQEIGSGGPSLGTYDLKAFMIGDDIYMAMANVNTGNNMVYVGAYH